MKIHQRKQCLVLPENATPEGWPSGWAFPPEAWPPGWPTKRDDACWLRGSFEGSVLTVRCLDDLDEDTDKIIGQMLLIQGSDGDSLCRLRSFGANVWSKQAAVKIEEFAGGQFGCRIALEFESPATSILVKLFGREPLLAATVMVG